MKSPRFIYLLLLSIFSLSSAEAGIRIPAPVFKTIVTVISGAAAAASLGQSATEEERRIEIDKTIEELKAKGIDPRDGAIYQLYFKANPKAAGRWFFKPNVYALIQIEGQGDYVPAAIARGYEGQEFSVTIYAHQIRTGGKVLVHLLDDKQWWNTAWNSILQTEIPISITGKSITPLVRAEVQSDFSIKLINKDVVFQPPGYIAQASITVPHSEDGIWLAEGRLEDKETHDAGRIQFAEIWRADVYSKKSHSTWAFIFWGALAIVLFLVFLKLLLGKKTCPTGQST